MAPQATLVGASQQGLDDATLDAVRPKVRDLLAQSPGFAGLSSAQQREIAQTMVRVAAPWLCERSARGQKGRGDGLCR